MEAFINWCKRVLPFIGIPEKTRAYTQRLDYLRARQTYISVQQEFVHRSRYRGAQAVSIIVSVAFLWAFVFICGRSISSAPFQMLLNLVSVRATNSEGTRFDAMVAKPITDRKGDPAQHPADPAEHKLGPDAETGAVASEPKSPPSGDGGRAEPLQISSVSAFLGAFGATSPAAQFLLACVIGILTFPFTNMLILSCLAATTGALCNYSLQALKQAREFASQAAQSAAGSPPVAPVVATVFGHRRVFSSLSATLVVGIAMGFSAFLAVSSGVLLIWKLPGGTPETFQNAACAASLLGFVVALLPDTALRFIENRVNQASQQAVEARQGYEATVAAKTAALAPEHDSARLADLAQRIESKLDLPRADQELLNHLLQQNAKLIELLNKQKPQ